MCVVYINMLFQTNPKGHIAKASSKSIPKKVDPETLFAIKALVASGDLYSALLWDPRLLKEVSNICKVTKKNPARKKVTFDDDLSSDSSSSSDSDSGSDSDSDSD